MNAPDAAGRLARLAARFDVEMAKLGHQQPGSHNDTVIRGRIRYLQSRGRSVCAEGGLEEPLWVNPSEEIPVMRGRAEAARLAHNQEVGGANPSPATNPTHQPIEVHHG